MGLSEHVIALTAPEASPRGEQNFAEHYRRTGRDQADRAQARSGIGTGRGGAATEGG